MLHDNEKCLGIDGAQDEREPITCGSTADFGERLTSERLLGECGRRLMAESRSPPPGDRPSQPARRISAVDPKRFLVSKSAAIAKAGGTAVPCLKDDLS